MRLNQGDKRIKLNIYDYSFLLQIELSLQENTFAMGIENGFKKKSTISESIEHSSLLF